MGAEFSILNTEILNKCSSVSRFLNSNYALHIEIEKGMDRMVAGVFSSDGAVSFAFIDWSHATDAVSYPQILHVGNKQISVGIANVNTENRYRIKIEKDSSVGRAVTVMIFDTTVKLIGNTVALEQN